MRPVRRTQGEIATEWDAIVDLRAEQIRSGRDLSFSLVLVPTILNLIARYQPRSVVDVGCGAGFLTREIAKVARRVIGVDVSTRSIELARRLSQGLNNVEFAATSIESYASNQSKSGFTLAVANMTLMTVVSLDEVLRAVARILVADGCLAFTIAHPCFWPQYWNYATEPWFEYMNEIQIEAEFRISLETAHGLRTTHIHRPVERYVSSLISAGFVIDAIVEPMPPKEIRTQYPNEWKYPRFLGMRCLKARRNQR